MTKYIIGIAIGIIGIALENPIITLIGVALAITYFIGRLQKEEK